MWVLCTTIVWLLLAGGGISQVGEADGGAERRLLNAIPQLEWSRPYLVKSEHNLRRAGEWHIIEAFRLLGLDGELSFRFAGDAIAELAFKASSDAGAPTSDRSAAKLLETAMEEIAGPGDQGSDGVRWRVSGKGRRYQIAVLSGAAAGEPLALKIQIAAAE